MGQSPCGHVNLGVDCRGPFGLMAQYPGDLGQDAPLRSIAVASPCRNKCAPPAIRSFPPVGGALHDKDNGGGFGDPSWGASDRMKILRHAHGGLSCFRYFARDWPTSFGRGSLSWCPPLPWIVSSPASQSTSSSVIRTISPARKPSRASRRRIVRSLSAVGSHACTLQDALNLPRR